MIRLTHVIFHHIAISFFDYIDKEGNYLEKRGDNI